MIIIVFRMKEILQLAKTVLYIIPTYHKSTIEAMPISSIILPQNNDIVLDGYSGSGMTGVASTLNKRNVIYQTSPQLQHKYPITIIQG